MFTYDDWINLSPDFPYVTRISNEDIFNIIFDEYPGSEHKPKGIPVTFRGDANIYDGVPLPTLLVVEDQDYGACPLLEAIFESVFDFCGYAASRVIGTTVPTKVTYTGTSYVVQSIGRLDEGFPNLEDSLRYCWDYLPR